MFESAKNWLQVRESKKKLKIKNNLYEAKSIEYAIKAIDSALEARNRVTDPDLDSGQWVETGSDSRGRSEIGQKNLQDSAYTLYRINPHARAIVRGLVKFVLGKGPQLIPNETDEGKKEKLLYEWKAFKKKNRFSRREKELATRLFRDGEVFIRKFIDKDNGDMKVRFIRPSLIANPNNEDIAIFDRDNSTKTSYGISTAPHDIEEVLFYHKVDGEGKRDDVPIPANEIYHLKIFADSDEKRGTTVYEPCIRRLTQYDEWLEDRIVLNKVRSAIALVRQVEGGSGKVKELRDNALADNKDESNKRAKMMNRGTIITASKGVKYELLSPNINASDVKDDGREMKLAIASAVGFPEMIFTADYANANYSSSLIAQNPFVREIEEWQDFLGDFYFELFDDVIQAKKDYGDFPEDIESEAVIEFPPMMRDDLDKLAEAFEILFRYKAISKKTWQAKMGLDPEIEKINMEFEDEDDLLPGVNPNAGVPGHRGGTSPFQMPRAPVNQFGAEKINEMIEAIKDKDWELVIDLVDNFGDMEDLLVNHGYIEEARRSFAEQDWIYLIHHLHPPEKGIGIETIHHCFLYSEKNMKGIEYKQKHIKEGKLLLHILDVDNLNDVPEVVYDHLNNGFKVRIKEIEKKKYAVLTGLVNLKKTKWSDQDK